MKILIYGFIPGSNIEDLLYSKAQSIKQAEEIKKHLIEKMNVSNTRIKVYQDNEFEKPNFISTINL